MHASIAMFMSSANIHQLLGNIEVLRMGRIMGLPGSGLSYFEFLRSLFMNTYRRIISLSQYSLYLEANPFESVLTSTARHEEGRRARRRWPRGSLAPSKDAWHLFLRQHLFLRHLFLRPASKCRGWIRAMHAASSPRLAERRFLLRAAEARDTKLEGSRGSTDTLAVCLLVQSRWSRLEGI